MSISIRVFSILKKDELENKIEDFKKNKIKDGFFIQKGEKNDFAIKKGKVSNWFSKVSTIDYSNDPFILDILKNELNIDFIPETHFSICPDKFYLKEGYIIIKNFVDTLNIGDYVVTFDLDSIINLDNYYKEYILPYKNEIQDGFLNKNICE